MGNWKSAAYLAYLDQISDKFQTKCLTITNFLMPYHFPNLEQICMNEFYRYMSPGLGRGGGSLGGNELCSLYDLWIVYC